MKRFIQRVLAGLFLLLALLQPVPAHAYTPTGSETGVVSAEFTRGGLYLTVSNNHERLDVLIVSAEIEYCDGTRSGEIMYHIPLRSRYTYISEKPIKNAQIQTTRPDREFTYKHVFQMIRIQRSCAPVSPPARLYCGQASIPAVVHRGAVLPLSFSAPPSVHRAGLRIPGVDHLVYAQRVRGDLTYHWERTMSYGYRHRRWVATLPSFKIPVGTYEDIELVVQDGHGRQAKCSVGDLTVLP